MQGTRCTGAGDAAHGRERVRGSRTRARARLTDAVQEQARGRGAGALARVSLRGRGAGPVPARTGAYRRPYRPVKYIKIIRYAKWRTRYVPGAYRKRTGTGYVPDMGTTPY